MWESLLSHPRGRLSTRKYITIATAFLVVCFAYIFIAAPTVLAADAEWNNGSIVYEGDTYKGPTTSKGAESHDLPKDTIIYEFKETVNGGNGGPLQKAHLIYFPSGTDPATTTSASLRTYSLDAFNTYLAPSAEKKITLTPPTQDPEGTAATPESDNPGTSSCVVEGVGWMVCPITSFLAKGMDTVYSWVDGFLEVRPLATTQDQALYRAWSYMRTFANIAFIIAFLIVIYSQIANIGLSNYDIKKMLPRLIIAAILVNTSYWICAVAVDLFNILGYSVQDLFIMIRNSLVGTEGNSWDVVSWESFAALVLSGGSIAGGAGIAAYLGITSGALAVAGAGVVGGLVVLLLPVLLSLLFVILMTFLILAARQAIITILIVIAPLAFVAFLLPNTEKWFEKWRSTLFTLLLLFPAFSLVFGGAQLASAIIIQNATSINVVLLAMAVQIAPLLITPLLLKLGGGVLNRFAGIVNNPTKGVFDRGKNWARERTEQNKAAGLATLDERAKKRGFHNGRPTTGNWRQRTRLNPNNMAYLREYRRRERTGMKSANEAMSEGMFVQTAAGQRIHDRTKNAGLEKHAGETANSRQWHDRVATGTSSYDAYRRDLHHRAHEDENVAKMFEENLNAGGDEHFRETVLNSNRLTNLAINTNELNKRADQAKAIVDDQANIHWEDLSLNDRQIYSRQLQRQGYAKRVKAAEAEWDSILAEAGAGRTDDYQGKFGPITRQVNDAVQTIRIADETIAVEALRKTNAEYVVKTELNTALKSNDVILDRAAGIDENGRTKVVAQLYKEGSALYMQNVEAVESMLSNEGYMPEDLIRTYQTRTLRSGEPASDMHIHAAMRQLLSEKGNNTSIQKMSEFVGSQGMTYDAATQSFTDQSGNVLSDDEVENRRNLQQIFVDALNKSSHSVTHVSGTDKSAMQTGTYTQNTSSAIIRDIREGKIKAERVGRMDLDEMVRSVQVFRDNPAGLNSISAENRRAYIQTIDDAVKDPVIGAKLEARHKRVLEAMKAFLDPDTPPPATNSEIDTLAGRHIPLNFDPLTLWDQ